MTILREVGFIVLIFSPLLLTGVAVVLFRQRGTRLDWGAGAVLAAVAYLSMALLAPLCVSESHARLSVSVTLAALLYGITMSSHRWGQRWSGLMGIVLAGTLTSLLLYSDVTDGYTDNPRTNKARVAMQVNTTRQLVTMLQMACPTREFPAGPVTADGAILQSIPKEDRESIRRELARCGYHWRLIPRWHTPITGLYHVERTPDILWYPGGKVRDAAEKIKWQEGR